ncbi:unnamed protein product, partial [Nesidiocoris tenuis]
MCLFFGKASPDLKLFDYQDMKFPRSVSVSVRFTSLSGITPARHEKSISDLGSCLSNLVTSCQHSRPWNKPSSSLRIRNGFVSVRYRSEQTASPKQSFYMKRFVDRGEMINCRNKLGNKEWSLWSNSTRTFFTSVKPKLKHTYTQTQNELELGLKGHFEAQTNSK